MQLHIAPKCIHFNHTFRRRSFMLMCAERMKNVALSCPAAFLWGRAGLVLCRGR